MSDLMNRNAASMYVIPSQGQEQFSGSVPSYPPHFQAPAFSGVESPPAASVLETQADYDAAFRSMTSPESETGLGSLEQDDAPATELWQSVPVSGSGNHETLVVDAATDATRLAMSTAEHRGPETLPEAKQMVLEIQYLGGILSDVRRYTRDGPGSPAHHAASERAA